MRHLPSRLRRLDDALADLPLDEPMLLTELDGFLTGILVGPEPVPPIEWMAGIWGSEDGGVPPFDEPADVRWFADAVMARHDEIARDLARGKPQPLFDIDERNGDLLWESWIDGFAQAIDLRPEAWAALPHGGNADAAQAAACLSTLIAVAFDESELDSQQINALQDAAPQQIVDCVLHLYRLRGADPGRPAAPSPAAKVGRNEPCACGSGKKFKRCCGDVGMTTSEARILHTTVRVPFDRAYAFAHLPENFPLWAAGLSESLRVTDRGWVAETPEGEALIRFSEPNAYGVLDHRIEMPGRPTVSVPLRMIPNGDGTEVELILFRQPGMSEADFKRDARMVRADLQALKDVLEGRRRQSSQAR